MNTEALTKLADFLDTLPTSRFNFRRYFGHDWTPEQCGTTACALGWATTIPEFKMSLYRASDHTDFCHPGRSDGIGVNGDAWETVCAATLHTFDLTPEETQYLFVPDIDHDYHDISARPCQQYALTQKATPKHVAEHIRDFIAVGIRYDDV